VREWSPLQPTTNPGEVVDVEYQASRVEIKIRVDGEIRQLRSRLIVAADGARSLLKLMDALEDLDDVQSVTANFEMADELMSLTMV
jgi:transcriptional/translational regulatory protein YebC/TACO1